MARYILFFVLLQALLHVSLALGQCDSFELQNGRIEVLHNLFLRAHCDLGYILHGNFLAICTVRNEWRWSKPAIGPHGAPICIEIEKSVCEELPTPLNGKMECESEPVTVGKSCKFKCLEGYVRTGSENRTCLERLNRSHWYEYPTHWSGTSTQCLSKEIEKSVCEELPTPLNGKMECESEPVTVGKSCKFKCLEGYVQTGSENRTCLERPKSRTELPPHWPGILTKWSGTPTQCLPKLNSTVRGHQPNYNYDSYRMNGQNASTDFDENPCSNYGCEHWCIRKLGKPECGCRGGFILDQRDKRSCIGKKSTRAEERREKEDKSFSGDSLLFGRPESSFAGNIPHG